MSLIDTTNEPLSKNTELAFPPATNVAPVATVEPPSPFDVLDTLAALIEHSGLHHNEKFGAFVNDVRAFQRSVASEKSSG